MTAPENFYFVNINPSDYSQIAEVKKKLSPMTVMMEELTSLLKEDRQEEKATQIVDKQTELISPSKHDVQIEGFKLGSKWQQTYLQIHNSGETG